MTGIRYASGPWWGVAARGAVLLLAPDTAPGTVTRLLESLRSGTPIGGVLGVLAEASGSGLLSLPSFALLASDGSSTRLVLRGVDASVDGRVLSGAGVLTWAEHELEAGATVALGSGTVDPGLELVDGVVRCAVLVAGDVVQIAAPAAAPIAAPPIAAPEALDSGETLLPSKVVAEVPEPVEQIPLTVVEPEPEPEGPVTRPAPVRDEEAADLTGLTDLLGGHTVVRSIADAARWPGQEPEVAPPPAAAPPQEPDPDHDGFTMLRSELQDDAETSVRVSIGSLRLHDGRTWDLDRPVIIGRRPQANRVSAGEVPHLVTVESPTQDISRSHVEIRPEGAHAVVVDLGTTNGTTLRRPGKPPQRLVANDRHVLADQDVIDLGDDVLVTFSSGEARE